MFIKFKKNKFNITEYFFGDLNFNLRIQIAFLPGRCPHRTLLLQDYFTKNDSATEMLYKLIELLLVHPC